MFQRSIQKYENYIDLSNNAIYVGKIYVINPIKILAWFSKINS